MRSHVPGLDRQFRVLRDALTPGGGAVVLVEGCAGVGKTTLLRHAVGLGLQTGYVVGAGVDVPNLALAPAVPLPVIADEPGVPQLRGWLEEQRAAPRPPLVVLDDVHRLPPASAHVLAALPAQYPEAAWTLSRTTGLGGHELDRLFALDRPEAVQIGLDPLTGTETADLLADLLGRPASPGLLAAARRAGGNRHFVVALVEGLAEEGRLAEAESALDPAPLPRRLHRVVGALLRRLSPGCRQFLQVAAVGGERCAVREVAGELGRSVGALLPVVTEAVEAGVLTAGPEELRFAQPVVRQALVESMPPAVRQALVESMPTPAREPPPGEPAPWGQLNDTERSIARLAGSGLTNRQIAGRICLSPHTVNYHLRKIFRKLDIQSRVELAGLSQLSAPEPAARRRPRRPPRTPGWRRAPR